MSINYSTKDLENRKFRECPDGSGEVVIATTLCNVDEIANAINGDDNGVSEITIVNYSLIANTAQAHTFPNGTNRFRIKIKECNDIEVSLDNFVSGNIYTIDVGCEWDEERIYLNGTTLYFRTSNNSSLQIMQWK